MAGRGLVFEERVGKRPRVQGASPPMPRNCFCPSVMLDPRLGLAGNDRWDAGRPRPALARRHLRGGKASGVAKR
eukprot:6985718-Alexandrium_andersonii.AAC.1